MKGLIIDDSSTIRMMVAKMLGELGYDSSQAKDGLAGFEMLTANHDFNFVLLDWNMPNMTGPEVLDALAKSSWRAIPVIMMTTENSLEYIQTALAKGASEYIMKPFSPDILAEKITMVTAAKGAA